MTSGPGYAKHPEHRVTVRPAGVRVRIFVRGELVADTRDAFLLEETGYRPVYYLRRKDVRMERLARSQHRSYCPFKGEASYFSLAGGAENAAWSYEDPYDEVSVIKDLLAFYPHKVDAIEAGL
ncbi:MAG TPA: DUF427 domain-containing protein [Burkholderiales bacterium]|nr:DUF427 domain-containing protein [Burkholderiales bacterium]